MQTHARVHACDNLYRILRDKILSKIINTMKKSINKVITLSMLIVLLLGIALRLNFYFSNSIDPFLSTPISLANLGMRDSYIKAKPFEGSYWAGHANKFSEHRILTSLLLVVMSESLGVKIEEIAYLPIIGMLIPLLGAVIIRLLTQSKLVVLAYTTFLVFTPFLDQFRFNYQPLAYLYHFLLLYFVVRLIFTGSENNSKRRAIILMILVLIIDSYQSYYAVELSNLMLFLGILVFIVLNNLCFYFPYPQKLFRYSVMNLSLISLLVLLGIDNIVYTEFTGDYPQKLFKGLYNIINIIMKTRVLQLSFTPTSPLVSLYLDVAIRAILILMVLIPMVFDGITRKGLLQKMIPLLPLFFGLLFYSILEPIVYQGITNDYVVSRNMILYLPIASFVVLGDIKISNKRIKSLMKMTIMLILILQTSRYAIISKSDYQSNLSRGIREYAMVATDRIMPYLTPRHIMSSHQISSIIFVQAVIHQKDIDISPNPFKDKVSVLYESLINNKEEVLRSEFLCDLIMARVFEDRMVEGAIWGGMSTHSPPFGSSLYNINNFSSFNKIYDNGMILYYARVDMDSRDSRAH